ncbi:MAG TPA: cell division protein CrgA [Frankiaceae bacterium]|nr:cell division protein CrgA [Frankiaceae bacterium]
MPESRRRKKKDARPAAPIRQAAPTSRKAPHSPPWFGGLLLGLFLLGIAWLLTYYFSNGGVLGMQHLGGWNLAVGFGFIVGGLGMATQWK